MRSSLLCNFEALPGVLGKRGNRAVISGEQGNKGQILRGTKTILGNREHKKTNFRFLGNRGTSQFIQGNKGTGTPPPPPWRASILVIINFYNIDLHDPSFSLVDTGIKLRHPVSDINEAG